LNAKAKALAYLEAQGLTCLEAKALAFLEVRGLAYLEAKANATRSIIQLGFQW